MVGRNDRKWKKCHFPRENSKLKEEYLKKYGILLKNPEQIEGIRAAGNLAAKILEATCRLAEAGIATLELNDFAHKLHLEAGAIPAPLNYGSPPFPKSICTSLNDVICHGIPDKIPLKEGDILNIDVTCILNGYFGDCSRMVAIGKVSEEKQHVMDVAYACLMRSIEILKPGIPLSQIGSVIEDYATSHGCSVVNQFVGHGVGLRFHEPPQVPHNRNQIPILLVPGMTFTIEPMINTGVREAVIGEDKWTARTKDGKPSAQWEHTLHITETGYEILTPWTR
jgi:methionyl aminopeptidase